MFNVSCLFQPRVQKKRANEIQCEYSDIPRKDVAGIKVCHLVKDDHKTAPIFIFFLL